MKVLLLNGSPNSHGCTFTALDEVASALHEAGVETELVQLGKADIRGCIGCWSCHKNGKCVFDDAVNETAKLMKECDGLIVGSPVYFASPNGSLLSFLDRLFASCKEFTYKPAAAVVSARRAGTTCSLDVLYKYFSISQMPIVTSDYWCMVHGNTPDEVRQDAEGMQMMRALGRNMAWLLKCLEAGKAAGIPMPETEPRIMTNFIRS